MTGDNSKNDPRPVAPRPPALADFGLEERDLKRMTLRRFLLLEELPTVGIVVIAAVSIWRFHWWGIAVAIAALGLIYLIRLAVQRWVWGRTDRALWNHEQAMTEYDHARRVYDDALDAWEQRQREDSG